MKTCLGIALEEVVCVILIRSSYKVRFFTVNTYIAVNPYVYYDVAESRVNLRGGVSRAGLEGRRREWHEHPTNMPAATKRL